MSIKRLYILFALIFSLGLSSESIACSSMPAMDCCETELDQDDKSCCDHDGESDDNGCSDCDCCCASSVHSVADVKFDQVERSADINQHVLIALTKQYSHLFYGTIWQPPKV